MTVETITVMDQIKSVMKRKGVSQRTLSAMTGIKEGRISDYLTGYRPNPTIRTVEKMCDALGIELIVIESFIERG